MPLTRRRLLTLASATTAGALALGGCSSLVDPPNLGEGDRIEIDDNHGRQSVAVPPLTVVATDNRLFETLAAWQVALAAAPLPLIPGDNPYARDSLIVDLGRHVEPDLEAVVAVQPDLIINGQRFAQYREDFARLVPQASIVELDPRDGESFDEELRRQVRTLGVIFDHQADAEGLVTEFDEAIAAVKAAYDPQMRVMAVVTSGGEINYAAPGSGRTLGPVFDILGLTPALSTEGTTDHRGDDISVEAIAASRPDLILAMDRDAAVGSEPGSATRPANDLLTSSPALRNVPAIESGRVVTMPPHTYLNEGIQTYTTFFRSVAETLERV